MVAALACLSAGLASAGLFDSLFFVPKAEVVNLAAYQRLTHIIVVAGSENYRPIREELLTRIEDGLDDSSCWAIMRHGMAAEKLNGISLDPPSPLRWNNDAEVTSQLLTVIPKRRHQLGVLVFWVRNWTGNVYGSEKNTPLPYRFDISFGRHQRTIIHGTNADAPTYAPYSRDAVAELYDSASGQQIWRGHMVIRPGTAVETNGELPYADPDVRAAQIHDETDEFVSFFVDNLVHPPDGTACVPRPELALAAVGAQDPNVQLIITLKTAADASERADAAKALGQEDNEAAVAPLIEALSDPELKVRAYALDSLGEIRSVKAVDAVVGKLADPDRLLRALAVRTLGKIGSNRASPALNNLLKIEKEPAVRKTAEQALAHINDPANMANLVIEIPSEWKQIEIR